LRFATSRLLRRASLCEAVVLCFTLYGTTRALAHDVSDELTLGRIDSPPAKTATPYWSDRARGSFEPNDAWAIDAAASVTHYGAETGMTATSIFQGMLGTSFTPSDHWALDVDAFLSPPSTSIERGVQVTQTSKGAVRDKSSSLGFDVGAEYDTSGDTNAESAFGLNAGATSYSTTQAVRPRRMALATGSRKFGAPEQASLVQWRADASFTETLFKDTDVSLLGTYYLYNRDTADSGYYGTSVFGRSVDDGIPVAPLQYAIRPTLTHRFGALQLRAFLQYGDYRYGDGTSLVAGLKAQYKFTTSVRAWIGGNLQRDQVNGSDLNLLSASIGLRLVF
jgi:hypothetical protein